MASSFAHFDDDGANKAPKGRFDTIALTDTSREISVDRLGETIASFDAMLSLLEDKEKGCGDAPRDPKIH